MFRQRGLKVMPNSVRATHEWVIGLPGTGKSKALETRIVQDMMAGNRGLGVLDPHGELYRNLTLYVAEMSLRQPEIAQRVVLIDPLHPTWTVSFNPLEVIRGMSLERAALFLTDVIVKIWKVDPTTSPRMVWLMTNSFLALSDLGLTLLDLTRWLGDAAWRNSFVPQLSHERVRGYWQYEFPKGRAEAQVWIAPVLNKIGRLIFDSDVSVMLTANASLNWRKILDDRLILLVNLPKGILGESNSALMAAFILAQIQKAALARADTQDRPPFHLYLDEFQNYTTDHIQEVITESRKYRLSLVLANQHLGQLESEILRSTIINTTGIVQCFRVGHHDAMILAKEIFPGPDYTGPGTDSPPKMFRLPEDEWKYRDWERLAQLLVNLPNRQYWVRRRGPYNPLRQRTLTLPDPLLTPQLAQALSNLEEISGQQFGRRKRGLALEVDDLTASQDRVTVQPSVSVETKPNIEIRPGEDDPQPEPDGRTTPLAVGLEAILTGVLDQVEEDASKDT